MVNWGMDRIGVWVWLNVPLMGMEGMEALFEVECEVESKLAGMWIVKQHHQWVGMIM